MKRRLFKTLVAVLAIAAAATGPARAQQTYSVTFAGFVNDWMNTTVSDATMPYSVSEINDYFIAPWNVWSGGDRFTNVYVASGGDGKVSVSVSVYNGFTLMTITVTGAFEGTATIHCEGKDDEKVDFSHDITVACVANALPLTLRRLDSIPQGWAVAAGGEALVWTAYEGNASMGYVEVPAGAQVTVTTPAGAHVGSMAVRYGVQAEAAGLTVTTDDIGKVIAADGNLYADVLAAANAGTVALAMIAYVDGGHGLAFALEEAGSGLWSQAASTVGTWAASHAVANGTWRVPSANDLILMFRGCGSETDFPSSMDEYNYYDVDCSGFSTKYQATSGASFTDIWTSDTYDDEYLRFDLGQSMFSFGSEGNREYRAVLEFAVQAPAPAGLTLDLATVTAATTVEDGYTVTGTLGNNVKISIADGATVTLDGVTINGVSVSSSKWAGITCLGDATIILSGTNTVKGFYEDYPGIFVPENKTLTIQGAGSLTASSNGFGAGIGGGYQIACGNIVIEGGTVNAQGGTYAAGIGGGNENSCGNISITGGTVNAQGGYNAAGIGSGSGDKNSCGNISITGGTITATGGNNYGAGIGSGYRGSCGTVSITGGTITATGGNYAAGIGSGYRGSCDNISITGGTITATGGNYGAGIGSGDKGSCGTVTITGGVTSVTATKGFDAPNSIGAGYNGTCGTVTIGGTVGAITTSPYTYTPGN